MEPFEQPGNVWLRSVTHNTLLSFDKHFSQDLESVLGTSYIEFPVLSTAHGLPRETRPNIYSFNFHDEYEALNDLRVLADEQHWYGGSEIDIKESFGRFISHYKHHCLQTLVTEESRAGFAAYSDYLDGHWMPLIREGNFTEAYDQVLEVVRRSELVDLPTIAEELPAYQGRWKDPQRTEYNLIQLGKHITGQYDATNPREQQLLDALPGLANGH